MIDSVLQLRLSRAGGASVTNEVTVMVTLVRTGVWPKMWRRRSAVNARSTHFFHYWNMK